MPLIISGIYIADDAAPADRDAAAGNDESILHKQTGLETNI